MESIDNIRNAGLKLTPQRIAVYSAMISLRHARLEAIVKYLNEHYGRITLSTVYRVLESFCEAGLLSLVCRPDTCECYYYITASDHHHLFSGDTISDYQDEELTQLVLGYIKSKRPDIQDIEKIQVLITTNKP